MNDIEMEDTYKECHPWKWKSAIGWMGVGAFLLLSGVGLVGIWSGGKVEVEEKSSFFTQCNTAKTWQITDWNIDCKDGYTYQRIEPPTFGERQAQLKAEEEQKKIDEAERKAREVKYESDRYQWLVDHPKVKELFDPEKRDLEYTVSYIRKNWYHGDCALAWHQEILCWEVGGRSLIFPTERPNTR